MDRRATPLALVLFAALGCSPRDAAVSPVDGSTRSHAARPAASVDPKLDGLIRDGWSRGNITPAPHADDATFLRRASLDLTGRIPTEVAVRAFEADTRSDKRAVWIDRMLASRGYAEHWAGLYTDLLLAGRTKDRKGVTQDTQVWLQGALGRSEGYDKIATELLTATGRFEGPGPYGFLISHGERDNIEALTGKTAKVFLGITLECAQCHDHPTDPRYAQTDFYALGAYFGRTKIRFRKEAGQRVPSVVDKRRGELHMPTATDGPRERSGSAIAPGFLSRASPEHESGRRWALARDIVASDLFAKTVVARTWQHLFGHGLVPRWDDLGGEHDRTHPEALDHLAAQFVARNYDLRALLRTIVLSDAYQRASASPGRSSKDARAAQAVFAQQSVRPMNADQLFRSLMIATSADGTGGPLFRKNFEKRRDRALAEYRFIFSDDEMESVDAFSGSVPQALLLLGGDLVRAGTTDVRGTSVHAVLDQLEDPAERVDALYVRVFGRHPTPAQRARVLQTLDARGDGSSAYEDLVHAMLLSSEFLTIH